MATYAQVINNNGTVTIDDSIARLVKTRSVSLTTSETTTEWPQNHFGIEDQYAIGRISRTQVTLASNEKLVAIRAKAAHNNVAFFSRRSGSSTVYVYAISNLVDRNLHRTDYTLDVYGYVPTTGASSGSGMQIFNAAGDQIFNSNYYGMDVKKTYYYDHSPFDPASYGEARVVIGGYSYEDTSVVINNNARAICLRSLFVSTYGYGLVFSTSSLRLEHRIGVGESGENMPSYSSMTLWPAGISMQSNMLLLDSQNIW